MLGSHPIKVHTKEPYTADSNGARGRPFSMGSDKGSP